MKYKFKKFKKDKEFVAFDKHKKSNKFKDDYRRPRRDEFNNWEDKAFNE